MSKLLVRLQAIRVQGAGLPRWAERQVPEPGGRRQVRADAKGKVVDLSALQCVAGVVLVSFVPRQDASFVLRSC